jgi:hypothetical protein
MEHAPDREPGFRAWLKFVWREGLARKMVVEKGESTIVRLPLTAVVVGAALAPWIAAVGLVVAVIAGCRLTVEREPLPSEQGAEPAAVPETEAPGAVAPGEPAAAEGESEKGAGTTTI